MRDPEEIKEWINKAEDDFEGAKDIARRRKRPLPDLVCFHCQQSAEKYLKSLLIFKKTPFPKTHDLLLLLEYSKRHNPNLELHRELFEFLNPYSVVREMKVRQGKAYYLRTFKKKLKEIRKIIRKLFPEYLLRS